MALPALAASPPHALPSVIISTGSAGPPSAASGVPAASPGASPGLGHPLSSPAGSSSSLPSRAQLQSPRLVVLPPALSLAACPPAGAGPLLAAAAGATEADEGIRWPQRSQPAGPLVLQGALGSLLGPAGEAEVAGAAPAGVGSCREDASGSAGGGEDEEEEPQVKRKRSQGVSGGEEAMLALGAAEAPAGELGGRAPGGGAALAQQDEPGRDLGAASRPGSRDAEAAQAATLGIGADLSPASPELLPPALPPRGLAQDRPGAPVAVRPCQLSGTSLTGPRRASAPAPGALVVAAGLLAQRSPGAVAAALARPLSLIVRSLPGRGAGLGSWWSESSEEITGLGPPMRGAAQDPGEVPGDAAVAQGTGQGHAGAVVPQGQRAATAGAEGRSQWSEAGLDKGGAAGCWGREGMDSARPVAASRQPSAEGSRGGCVAAPGAGAPHAVAAPELIRPADFGLEAWQRQRAAWRAATQQGPQRWGQGRAGSPSRARVMAQSAGNASTVDPSSAEEEEGGSTARGLHWAPRVADGSGQGQTTGRNAGTTAGAILPGTTYDDLLSSSRPFGRPIPLPEMIDFLVDIWREEGLYD